MPPKGIAGARPVQTFPLYIASQEAAVGAANTQTITVPATAEWVLNSIYATIVTANAGSPRRILVTIDDGANVVMAFLAGADQAINSTAKYTFAPDLPNDAAFTGTTPNQYMCRGIPAGLVLPAGYRVTVAFLSGVQGADTIAVRLMTGEA